jgi:hypothetical protein
VLGLAPEVAVCTAMGTTVHRRGHRHPMAVHRPIFLERRENGAGLGWHRHPLSGATAVCPVTMAGQTSRWIRPLEFGLRKTQACITFIYIVLV